ncbi:hypothetical protein [Methylobacterium sp. ID0610]|uniref:hypothetical protein n=1 Tax=Methylobacterium carpenticola TaxID=3344827 RepID=UPI0036908134
MSRVASAAPAILDPQAIVLGGRLPTILADRLIPQIAIDGSAANPDPRPRARIAAGMFRALAWAFPAVRR